MQPWLSGVKSEFPDGKAPGNTSCTLHHGAGSGRYTSVTTGHKSAPHFPYTVPPHPGEPRFPPKGSTAGCKPGGKEDLPPPPGLEDVHKAPGSVPIFRPAAQGTALGVPRPTQVLPSGSKDRLKHTRLLSGRHEARGPILAARRLSFGVHKLAENRLKRKKRRQKPHLQGKDDDRGG